MFNWTVIKQSFLAFAYRSLGHATSMNLNASKLLHAYSELFTMAIVKLFTMHVYSCTDKSYECVCTCFYSHIILGENEYLLKNSYLIILNLLEVVIRGSMKTTLLLKMLLVCITSLPESSSDQNLPTSTVCSEFYNTGVPMNYKNQYT